MNVHTMKHALLLMGSLMAFPAIAQEDKVKQFVVTTTEDSGPGSLRQAISRANAYNQCCKIVFDIPTSDEGYNKCFHSWTIKPLDELPAICTKVTIDGYCQKGAECNTHEIDSDNNAQLAIEISGPGLEDVEGTKLEDLFRGLTFREGSQGATVQGLAINDCPIGIEVLTDEIKIHGNFLGTGVDGFTLKDNLVSIHIADTACHTVIGDEKPCNRNLIAGLGRQASSDVSDAPSTYDNLGAITNLGAHTSIQNATVNLVRSGTEALTRAPGFGILSVANQSTVLGGPNTAHRVIVANYDGANIQFDSTYDDAVQQVYAGTNILGKNALGGGAGIRFINRFGVSTKNAAKNDGFLHSVNKSLFSGNQGSGIVIGDALDPYPVSLVSICNTYAGTDKCGQKGLPNNKHGLEINQGADTSVTSSVFNYNHIHGAFSSGSLRTHFKESDVSFNVQDGINFISEDLQGKASVTPTMRISGSFINNCDHPDRFAVNKWGSRIFCN